MPTATKTTKPLGPAAPPTSLRRRQTDSFDAYYNNVGIVARRGWDERTAAFLSDAGRGQSLAIRQWADSAPLRILSVLIDADGLAQMAMSNDLTLAFAPGDTRIVAVKDYRQGKGTLDDDESGALDRLWRPYHRTDNDLAAEVGGLMTLQQTLAEQVNKLGMYCVEAKPGGAKRMGVTDIADFDPLRSQFKDKDDGSRVFEFRTVKDGWQELNMSTILAVPWRGNRSNPYGMPRYGAFLSEGLTSVAEQKNLKDWMHAAAWPRVFYKLAFESLVKYAQDNSEVCIGAGDNGEDLKPGEWALTQFDAFVAKLQALKADDPIVGPVGSEAQMLNASDMSGLSDVLAMRRLRCIQSLDQLPSMMGVTDGGTQAYASVQWTAQTKKLEALRAIVNSGLVAIANLDLRLRGIDMKARVEAAPIRSLDMVAEQNARSLQIGNTLRLVDRGYLQDEDAAIALTGSGVVDEELAQAARNRALAGTQTDTATTQQPQQNPQKGNGNQ